MEAQHIGKAFSTEIASTESGSKPERKALGLVWITCPYPVIARGLEEVLTEEAQVYVGQKPPGDEIPSCIIFCPDRCLIEAETKNLTSEVKRLRERAPYAPILVFCMRVDLQVSRAAFRAGVHGFIYAGMQPAQIVNAISLASAGGVVIPGELLRDLVVEEPHTGTDALTFRQREILTFVAEGLTNAQIAQRLYLSEFTIKQHLRHAYKVLKVRNRTEAARLIGNRT
jgi:DNA-binding NarL/FixJ family response regulator